MQVQGVETVKLSWLWNDLSRQERAGEGDLEQSGVWSQKERPHDLWRISKQIWLSPIFPRFGQTNIGAHLMAYPNEKSFFHNFYLKIQHYMSTGENVFQHKVLW